MPTPIKVRIALHTGAAESRDRDFFGPPLNRAARLLAAASLLDISQVSRVVPMGLEPTTRGLQGRSIAATAALYLRLRRAASALFHRRAAR